nr:hypothetical protein [Streptomyces benahoarensis]
MREGRPGRGEGEFGVRARVAERGDAVADGEAGDVRAERDRLPGRLVTGQPGQPG